MQEEYRDNAINVSEVTFIFREGQFHICLFDRPSSFQIPLGNHILSSWINCAFQDCHALGDGLPRVQPYNFPFVDICLRPVRGQRQTEVLSDDLLSRAQVLLGDDLIVVHLRMQDRLALVNLLGDEGADQFAGICEHVGSAGSPDFT